MEAIRQFIDVKDNSFQVTLPDGFRASRVEVIILPISENASEISEQTKKMLDDRLESYRNNPSAVFDLDQMVAELNNEL